jgi:hypothetical protein
MTAISATGFDQFIAAILPFTRHLTGVRASLAALSGFMIAAIAGFSVSLWLAGRDLGWLGRLHIVAGASGSTCCLAG